ncbi:MAG: hypothetical protein K8R02_02160 [Anaerohalosphaeraceae bacterium]|nr:hypothetical protein [Anaerohalosphaeraceae bacterium]
MSKKTVAEKKNCDVDLELAIQISDQIELKEVRLLESSCSQQQVFVQGEKQFDINRTVRVEVDMDSKNIMVFPTFELKGYSESEALKQNNPFLNIKAVFLLVYQAKDLSNFNQKAFDSFGQANGIYNAWPYWREYVQNTTSRMGLPVLTVPVFRVIASSKKQSVPKKVKSNATAKKGLNK